MRVTRLQDVISRGMGVAARKLGCAFDVFRPRTAFSPLDPSNRYLKLTAAFNAEDPSWQRAGRYGHPVWYGVFDSAYTAPGDFLVAPGETYFIAAQRRLLPTICIRTNAVISVSRPAAPALIGPNLYGGFDPASATLILSNWPASLIVTGGLGKGDLPGETRQALFTCLLPMFPALLTSSLRAADVVSDESGRMFVVASSETSDLGSRLTLKQVMS